MGANNGRILQDLQLPHIVHKFIDRRILMFVAGTDHRLVWAHAIFSTVSDIHGLVGLHLDGFVVAFLSKIQLLLSLMIESSPQSYWTQV